MIPAVDYSSHVFWLSEIWHPLQNGGGYNFWSGLGSDFSELALFGILITMFRHVNCHVSSPHFCWRFGHPVNGTSYRACHKHHPTRISNDSGKVTAADIKRRKSEVDAAATPLAE